MTNLPELYFRIRDNGAAVFRINTENRERRIEMDQIAVVNTNRGDFKAQGDNTLSPEEETVINDWLQSRLAILAARDAQLEEITDDLLMAMHDLRSVLVRKKSDRVSKS